jgi:hypothetical protein
MVPIQSLVACGCKFEISSMKESIDSLSRAACFTFDMKRNRRHERNNRIGQEATNPGGGANEQ